MSLNLKRALVKSTSGPVNIDYADTCTLSQSISISTVIFQSRMKGADFAERVSMI